MLDERKRKILKEIVDEYIESAEPVSSAVIVEKYEQDISSATVRNDMAELEKAGYLEKPHTSAGRVPSAKGYRLYVDELLKYDNISLEDVFYLINVFEADLNTHILYDESYDESIKKENEYFLEELIGFQIIENEKNLGIVEDIVYNKSGILLEIKQKEKKYYIPKNDYFIKKVNGYEKTILVENTQGLI